MVLASGTKPSGNGYIGMQRQTNTHTRFFFSSFQRGMKYLGQGKARQGKARQGKARQRQGKGIPSDSKSGMEADRKIPAVKLFVSQLDNARQPVETTDNVVGIDNTNLLVELSLQGVGFTRVWLQVLKRVQLVVISLACGSSINSGSSSAVQRRLGTDSAGYPQWCSVKSLGTDGNSRTDSMRTNGSAGLRYDGGCCCCCCCCHCCCSHINSHNQVRGHRTGSSHSGRTGSSHSGVEEYPKEKT